MPEAGVTGIELGRLFLMPGSTASLRSEGVCS